MADPLDVLAEHYGGDEDRALATLARLQRAGLQVVAKPTDAEVLVATAFDVAGEPLLGPRQAALVHAVTCHLHQCAWPWGTAEVAMVQWAARVLGLPGL